MKIKFRPNLNHIKIVLAVVVLMFDLAGAISSWVRAFYPGVATFVLLSIVTLDYIRVIRNELKIGPYYVLDSVDN